MTGWWLASYLCLWVLVVTLCLLQIGSLRELGLLRRSGLTSVSNPPESGPPLGARLPSLTLYPDQGVEPVQLGRDADALTLLVFMTPMCTGCQSAAELLERFLSADKLADIAIRIVLCGPTETCRSFLSVFELPTFVTIDEDFKLPDVFEIQTYPFALLYNRDGALVRKEVISHERGLEAVMSYRSNYEPLHSNRT